MNEYTAEQLLEFFKTQFVAIDNIPEDTARRDQICMEARASLLMYLTMRISLLFNCQPRFLYKLLNLYTLIRFPET